MSTTFGALEFAPIFSMRQRRRELQTDSRGQTKDQTMKTLLITTAILLMSSCISCDSHSKPFVVRKLQGDELKWMKSCMAHGAGVRARYASPMDVYHYCSGSLSIIRRMS